MIGKYKIVHLIGSINQDYCKYCYKDGAFIDKVTMEEYKKYKKSCFCF